MPEFIESIQAAEQWQSGMNQAALDLNLALQWCMTTPTDVLASLDYNAVTNFRVSADFCYGTSYLIGVSSLLPWALGTAPSKDTFWTTDNDHEEVEVNFITLMTL